MIDPHVRAALEEAVAEHRQQRDLAEKLIAWLDAVSEGREEFANVDRSAKRLEVIFGATLVDPDEEDE